MEIGLGTNATHLVISLSENLNNFHDVINISLKLKMVLNNQVRLLNIMADVFKTTLLLLSSFIVIYEFVGYLYFSHSSTP